MLERRDQFTSRCWRVVKQRSITLLLRYPSDRRWSQFKSADYQGSFDA
jgi:hypothetical protein